MLWHVSPGGQKAREGFWTHVADVDAAGVPTGDAEARAGGDGAVAPGLAEVVLDLHEVALVGCGEEAA